MNGRGIVRKAFAPLLSKSQKDFLRRLPFAINRVAELRRRVKGRNNVFRFRGVTFRKTTIEIQGNDNSIFIGEGSRIENTCILVSGSGHMLIIGNSVVLEGVDLAFEDENCRISIGDRSVILNKTQIAAVEPCSKILIGSDCLFSSHVDIRTSDSHSIIDLATGKRINWAKDVIIQNHVWLGARVSVLKGVTIEHDCVVGIGSLVTKSIPENCVAGGQPARILHENATWNTQRLPRTST